MKKTVVMILALLIVATVAGTASAKARGYGLIFGVMDSETAGKPVLVLPSRASGH